MTYVRGRHGRYLVKNDNGVKDVVGIAYRGSRKDMKTMAKFAKTVNSEFDTKRKINPKAY